MRPDFQRRLVGLLCRRYVGAMKSAANLHRLVRQGSARARVVLANIARHAGPVAQTVALKTKMAGVWLAGGPAGAARKPLWRRPWLLIALTLTVALLSGLATVLWSLPLGRALEPVESPTLVLVAADGAPIARRGSYKEGPIVASALPAHVPGAFVAIEDRRFYEHIGLDAKAIARALGANAQAGGVSEGGSTITQQLAKNAFLTNERTLRRKAQEATIALYLEARLSKDEILSRYLSSVYFGQGAFGLRAAARQYFNKTPEALSVGEAAMLAGLVKAPSRLAPSENLPGARARMRTVLAAMVETGVITQRQADREARRRIVIARREKIPTGSYFADWVMPQARAIAPRRYGATVIATTLDSRLQAGAERILRDALAREGAASNINQGALVAMRANGEVVAMVGGREYGQSQFNRADAARQPGSAFKLFVYFTALREGATITTPILDTPVELQGWSPKNHEGKYAGRTVPLITAFAGSSNVAAVRLAQQVGRDDIVKVVRALGVDEPVPEDLTLALGTGPMSLVQLTGAYAAIAAGKAPILPHGLADWRSPRPARPLGKAELAGMRDMLRSAVHRGTGFEAAIPGAFGKTGTTQGYRDALFVGYVGDLVVGVWLGNDDNSPMRGVVGGGAPARIWRDFMNFALMRNAPRPRTEDSALETSPVDEALVDPSAPAIDPSAAEEPSPAGPAPSPTPSVPPDQPNPTDP